MAKCFAQVKEASTKRERDTMQNTMPSKLLAIAAMLACSAAQALDLNQATEADLDGVKGIGPSTTARILAARQAQPFKNWQDFMQRVKGIKTTTAVKLTTAGLTIEGAGYATPETPSTAASRPATPSSVPLATPSAAPPKSAIGLTPTPTP